MKKILIILIFSFILSGLRSETTTKKIICFGDSITYGAEVDQHSWAYFLSKEHKNINFINEGRNGRKTSDKNEFSFVLNKYPSADYFLIFLGVNDLKNGNDSMVNECVNNIEWMIKEIKGKNNNTNIVILSPCDINLQTMSKINIEKKYNKNTKTSLVELNKKYKNLAERESVEFISLLHAVSPENYVDGLHPNEAGPERNCKNHLE